MSFPEGELGPELRGLRPYECELGFEVQSWLEWSMEANAAGQIVHEWNLDGAAFTGAVAGAHAVAADLTYIYDPAGRRTVQTTRRTLESTVTESVTNHYADDSDSPAWVTSSTVQGLSSTVYVGLLTGSDVSLSLTTSDGATSGELALANPRGDVSATITLPTDGETVQGLDRWTRYTEYGTPMITPPAGTAGVAANGYGWLGAKQRTTTETGILLMGARLYNPVTALFTSLDPIYGGNDPINKQDTTGEWGWLRKVGKVLWKYKWDIALTAAGFIPVLGTASWLIRGGRIVRGLSKAVRAAKIANSSGKVKYVKYLSRTLNRGKARVNIRGKKGITHYDLHGRSHNSVKTPHQYLHRYGRPPFMGKKDPVKSSNWRDLTRVHYHLIRSRR